MKKNNLQPWLDYFELLHTYEQTGFLQMEVEKHEAYVTQTSLHTLSGAKDTQPTTTDDSIHRMRAYAAVIRRLRTYAAFLSTKGKGYLTWPFAAHLVKDEPPHDLLLTILLEKRRRWWSLWMKVDCFDVITYDATTPAASASGKTPTP